VTAGDLPHAGEQRAVETLVAGGAGQLGQNVMAGVPARSLARNSLTRTGHRSAGSELIMAGSLNCGGVRFLARQS
jgi:hypothetical protein